MKKITRKQALAEGKKTYYTGKPCSRGHISWRYVNNYQCSECREIVYFESYDEKKARLIKKHGEEKALEILREYNRKKAQQHRDKQGKKHTKYIREYMQQYRHTEEGAKNCKKAAQKYYNSPSVKKIVSERQKKYRQTEKGKQVITKAKKKRQEKLHAEMLERRAIKRQARIEAWECKYRAELKIAQKIYKDRELKQTKKR